MSPSNKENSVMISSWICFIVILFLHEIDDPLEPFNQQIDLLLRIINRKRSSHSSFESKALHKGLCAMVACTNSDSSCIEHLTNIEVMDAINRKSQYGNFILHRSHKLY